MKFNETLKIDKKEGGVPKKLEDMLPFLKPTEEEIEFNKKFKETTDSFTELMVAGKVVEAVKLAQSLKGNPLAKRKDFTEQEQEDFLSARTKIVEQLGYKVVDDNEEKWITLEKDGYTIKIKHFMLQSGSGYNNGRISEIQISKGKIYSVWNNGWDKEPKDEGVNKIFNELVNYIN